MQKFDSITGYGREILVGGSPKQAMLALFPNFTTITTDATAGALTYTAAMLLGGLIARDPAGAGRSDVTPTAALIIEALGGADKVRIGQSIMFAIVNTADAAEAITVTAGDSVTLTGHMVIAQNCAKLFVAVVTSTTTVTIAAVAGAAS